VGYRVCLALFALFWLTLGFGVIDLASGFASRSTDGNEVLSAAYGVIAAIVLPAGFLAQLRGASPRVAALQQVGAVAVAFTLAGVLALDPLSFISVATLAVMLVILWSLSSEPRRLWPRRVVSIRLSALTAMAAVPLLVHALALAANGRNGLPPDELAGRPQAGGWAGAVALELLVVLLGLLAATKTSGWRLPAFSAAAAALVFGLVSVLNPDAPGSAGAVWGALLIGWSVMFTGASLREPPETTSTVDAA
jgi:hypothetical protein